MCVRESRCYMSCVGSILGGYRNAGRRGRRPLHSPNAVIRTMMQNRGAARPSITERSHCLTGTVFVGHRSEAEVVHKNRPLWGTVDGSLCVWGSRFYGPPWAAVPTVRRSPPVGADDLIGPGGLGDRAVALRRKTLKFAVGAAALGGPCRDDWGQQKKQGRAAACVCGKPV